MISLGVGNAKGKVQIRNVKVKSAELFLPLDKVANWGFRDEKADDKQGGWHDQGPEYDAAKFPVKSTSFAGVPFHIVDPELNDGKAIIAFRCPKLPEAPGEVELDFGRLPAEKRYLYLLHCAAWEETQGARAGTIILYGPAGKTMELPVIYGRDLQEWWGGRGAENAFPGVYITAQAGGGVTPESIGAIRAAGVDAIHLSGKTLVAASGGPGGGGQNPVERTDRAIVRAAVLAAR